MDGGGKVFEFAKKVPMITYLVTLGVKEIIENVKMSISNTGRAIDCFRWPSYKDTMVFKSIVLLKSFD